MRALTEEETHTLFRKLADYTGRSLTNLISEAPPGVRASSDRYIFRLQRDRVYFAPESLVKLAETVPRENIMSVGTCVGKFTKSGKFRIHITALDIIAPYARYKIWVKPNGEMPFLYGGNIVKAHVGRWSEDCPHHQGVIVLNMNDTPLVSPPHALKKIFLSSCAFILTLHPGIWGYGTVDGRSTRSTTT